MPVLFEYLLKFSISLGAVYLFYILVLQRLTFYNWNRRYLFFYSLLCFVIPFTNVSRLLGKNKMDDNRLINFIPAFNFPGNTTATVQIVNENSSSLYYWQWGLIILLAGSFLLLVRLAVQYFSFLKMRNAAELLSDEEVKLYRVRDKIIPFSFNNSIFINHEIKNSEELKEIIRHEFVHVKQKHTIDILFAELLCVINWYNPFVWLMRKAIRQNLEFIADNNVLQSGFDRKQYQYLLLKVIGVSQFSITQQFNFSSLKKRIAMMNKLKSAKVHLIKFLFALPLTAILLLAFRDKIGHSVKSINDPVIKYAGIVVDVSKKERVNGVVVAYDKKIAIVDTPPPPPAAPPTPEINPTPAVTPTPPSPAVVPELPDNVEKIDIQSNQDNRSKINPYTVTVRLKSGTKEVYNLNNPKEKAAFKNKYGELPAPPPPPAKPREQRVASADIKNKGAMVLEVPAKPLYIVDDREMAVTEDVVGTINPSDIVRVDILKDKAATKKYGTKGKDGVVKITTKKNKTGEASAEIIEVREVPVARAQVVEVPVDAAEVREVPVAEVSVVPITKINGNADRVKITESKLPADAIYYIDDLPATRKQADQLDPANTQSIDVIKSKETEKNNRTKHIMKIATKKKIAV
jgi:BlaR1 peptidase M56